MNGFFTFFMDKYSKHQLSRELQKSKSWLKIAIDRKKNMISGSILLTNYWKWSIIHKKYLLLNNTLLFLVIHGRQRFKTYHHDNIWARKVTTSEIFTLKSVSDIKEVERSPIYLLIYDWWKLILYLIDLKKNFMKQLEIVIFLQNLI